MFKQIYNLFKAESLYEQALLECHEMLDIDATMFNESIDSLRKSDTADIPIDIYAMDQKINAFERDVRRKIMTHLAISGREDLGSGLVMVSVVIDIERIGDYTKNIYDLAVNYPKRLEGGIYEAQLGEIEENTKNLFNQSVNAFKEQDIEVGRELMKNYKTEISVQCDEITNNLISGKSNEIDSAQGSTLALYARYLKRISAHSRNLISSIVNPVERIGYPEK